MLGKPKDDAVEAGGGAGSGLVAGALSATSSSATPGPAAAMAAGQVASGVSAPGNAGLKASSAVSTLPGYGTGGHHGAASQGVATSDVKSLVDTGVVSHGGGVDVSQIVFSLQRDFDTIKKDLSDTKKELDETKKKIAKSQRVYAAGMKRVFRKFSDNVKKIEGDVAGEVDSVKSSIKVVEDSVKSMAMRHVEVLGVFSAILALLISSASIASNMKTVFGACSVLAMMVGVVVVLVAIVSNVVNGRPAVDRSLLFPVIVVISVLCGAFLLDGRGFSSEPRADEKAAENAVGAPNVHAGTTNATSSK